MDYKQKVASRKQKQKSTIYRYLMTRFMTHTPVELGKTGQGMGEDARRVSAVGTSRPLAIRSSASAFEKLLLMDNAKSEFLDFLPK